MVAVHKHATHEQLEAISRKGSARDLPVWGHFAACNGSPLGPGQVWNGLKGGELTCPLCSVAVRKEWKRWGKRQEDLLSNEPDRKAEAEW